MESDNSENILVDPTPALKIWAEIAAVHFTLDTRAIALLARTCRKMYDRLGPRLRATKILARKYAPILLRKLQQRARCIEHPFRYDRHVSAKSDDLVCTQYGFAPGAFAQTDAAYSIVNVYLYLERPCQMTVFSKMLDVVAERRVFSCAESYDYDAEENLYCANLKLSTRYDPMCVQICGTGAFCIAIQKGITRDSAMDFDFAQTAIVRVEVIFAMVDLDKYDWAKYGVLPPGRAKPHWSTTVLANSPRTAGLTPACLR